MDAQTLPFTLRLRKPFWLLMSCRTGETAVYGAQGQLIAERASDELIAFAVDNFVDLILWSDLRGPTQPTQMAGWMRLVETPHYRGFVLRDLYTRTSMVIATPDS